MKNLTPTLVCRRGGAHGAQNAPQYIHNAVAAFLSQYSLNS